MIRYYIRLNEIYNYTDRLKYHEKQLEDAKNNPKEKDVWYNYTDIKRLALNRADRDMESSGKPIIDSCISTDSKLIESKSNFIRWVT